MNRYAHDCVFLGLMLKRENKGAHWRERYVILNDEDKSLSYYIIIKVNAFCSLQIIMLFVHRFLTLSCYLSSVAAGQKGKKQASNQARDSQPAWFSGYIFPRRGL